MTPDEERIQKNQIETRLRTLHQCALALLQHEKELQRQLSEVNVSHHFSNNSSGDKKTLSPEELLETLVAYKLKPGRKPPADQ